MKKLYLTAFALMLVLVGCSKTVTGTDFIFKSDTNYFICRDGKMFRSALNNTQLGKMKAYSYEGALSAESITKINDLFGKKSINFKSDYEPDPNIFGEYQPCPNFQYRMGVSTRKVDEEECKLLMAGLNKITDKITPPDDYARISITKPGDNQYDQLSPYVTKRLNKIDYTNSFDTDHVLYSGYMQTNKLNEVIVMKPQDLTPTALTFASSEATRNSTNVEDIDFRVANPNANGADYLINIDLRGKYILTTSANDLCHLKTDTVGKIITDESHDSDGDGISDEIELLLMRDPFDATNNNFKYLH